MHHDAQSGRHGLVLDETLPDLKPIKVEYDAAPNYLDAIRAANYRCDQHKIEGAKSEGERQEQTREAKIKDLRDGRLPSRLIVLQKRR